MHHTLQLVLKGTSRVSSRCLAKRSRALRGRNPARDSQADRAPMALAPPLTGDGEACFCPIGHGSHASEKPRGMGRSPSNHLFAHRLCGRALIKSQRPETHNPINSNDLEQDAERVCTPVCTGPTETAQICLELLDRMATQTLAA